MLTLPRALLLLRLTVAGVFLAHAAVRVAHDTIPSFATFLASKGLPWPTALVWAITAFELGGGTALALGRLQRLLAVGFFVLLAVGIGLIHLELGWFVGEHGTGGMEYSVVLMACCAVLFAQGDVRSGRPRP